MAEVTSTAYQDIRDYIQNNWVYVELRDQVGTALMRLPVSDTRVDWTHTPGDQTMELTAIIKGSDAELGSLPKTLNSSAIFKTAVGGSAISIENFSASFTFQSVDDQLTVKHRIQVPKLT